MSIPLGAFTPTPVISPYLPPLTDDYNPTTMRCTGGVAINDGTQGREVQFWTVAYDGTNINVSDSGGTIRFQLAVAGVLSVSLAFDSNMAVALGYMRADGAYCYFFNGQANQYQTVHVAGVTSCRIAVDKTSAFFSGQSDVIFAYVSSGGTLVHWRQQRDRYAIEYTVPTSAAPVITADNPLIKLGPSLANRLQFEFYVAPPPPPPAIPLFQAIKPTLPLQRLIPVSLING